MRTITLSSAELREAFVDDEDFDKIICFNWHLLVTHYKEYAYRWEHRNTHNKRTAVLMHREIMNAPKGMIVDHINGDGLDNRKANLRVTTYSVNNHNARKLANATSQYKGVHWEASRSRWKATINIDGKSIFLGRFHDETDAALAYLSAKQLYFQEIFHDD